MLVITCLGCALAFSQAVPAAESTGRIVGRVTDAQGTRVSIARATPPKTALHAV